MSDLRVKLEEKFKKDLEPYTNWNESWPFDQEKGFKKALDLLLPVIEKFSQAHQEACSCCSSNDNVQECYEAAITDLFKEKV
jgi:hypothetical protein